MKKLSIVLVTLVAGFFIAGCELLDPHNPPKIKFKTEAGYTYEDVTVAPGTTVLVGIIGEKVEDDMKRYNISYAYDGVTKTTTQESFSLSGSQQKHYDKDYEITMRNQEGVEKWFFTITDRDGNIAKLKLTITVVNP